MTIPDPATGGPTNERCPKCGNTIGNAVPAYSSGALRCATCKTLWSFAETPLCSSPPAAPGVEAIPEPTAEDYKLDPAGFYTLWAKDEDTRTFGCSFLRRLAAAERRAADLAAEVARLTDACSRQDNEVSQTLAQAIGGFPWFKDDQQNFPGATEANGVCVGEHVAETLATVAARELAALRTRLGECEKALRPFADIQLAPEAPPDRWLVSWCVVDTIPEVSTVQAAAAYFAQHPEPGAPDGR